MDNKVITEKFLNILKKKFNDFQVKNKRFTDENNCPVLELGTGKVRLNDTANYDVICYCINYNEYTDKYNEEKGENRSNVLTEKSGKSFQFKVTKNLFKNKPVSYAIVVFYDNTGACRMSLVKKIYSDGKRGFSKFNRQTHFFRLEENVSGELEVKNNKTFEKYVLDSNKWLTAENLTDSFSIEKVTKEFYSSVANWYYNALETIGERKGFPVNINTYTEKSNFVVRMITRIMFIWFLKERELVDKNLFEEEFVKKYLKPEFDDSYYKAILQNLFFATLSTKIEKRQFRFRDEKKYYNKDFGNQYVYRYIDKFRPQYQNEETINSFFERTPFFNGGLFECHDIRYHGKDRSNGKDEFYDGFSENEWQTRLCIPNDLFFNEEDGLFSILKRYNFTIDENSVNDNDISIDPELLGKVFEGLLGAIDPETGEKERNTTGSFYTPREIVDYMCKESLKEYLLSKNSHIDPEKLDLLFNEEFEENPFENDYSLTKNIIKWLYDIKILDPACGSGAFPMGILLVMTNALAKLEKETRTYEQKSYIIQNCVYGVDIQQMAQEISFLRFFLTLLVDEKINNDPKDNFGIKPLPNLDFKIMQGNSLVENYKNTQVFNIFGDADREEYNQNKLDYILTSDKDKKAILKEKIYNYIYETLSVKIEDLELKAMIQGKKEKNFFLYDVFFGEVMHNGGFDIVIGNPPYIQLQTMKDELKKAYSSQGFEVYNSMGDIYCLFYEKGIDLLNDKGNLCYITSNKWMRAGYGEKLRDYFCKYDPKLLIDLGPGVFESATVDTNILVIKKMPPTCDMPRKNAPYSSGGWKNSERILTEGETMPPTCKGAGSPQGLTGGVSYNNEKSVKKTDSNVSHPPSVADATATPLINMGDFMGKYYLTACSVKAEKGQSPKDNLAQYISDNSVVLTDLSKDAWSIGTQAEMTLKKKIENIGTPLGQWDVKINRGILTGYNEAFIIDTAARNDILNNCRDKAERDITEKIIRPILRGRDIKRYSYTWADLWLINTHNGLRNELLPININDYPAVKKHLDQYWNKIKTRSDKGDTPYNLRNCAYLKDFEKEKIVWKAVGKNLTFSILESNSFVSAPACLLVSENNKYILGFLCSKFTRYFVLNNSDTTGAGDVMLNIQSFIRIPIPKVTEENKNIVLEIENLVDIITENKKKNIDTTEEEAQIDRLVYKLYSLTDAEIAIIENN